MAKAKTTRARTTTRKAVQNTTDTAEARRTTAAKTAATEKQFANADEAALRGLPENLTREQHENQVRRAALGY
jgi:hypothetical protein